MKVALTKLKNNPKNPRVIRDEKFNKLKKSIEDFPDMLEKRPLVVFTDKDGKYVVLGGNMRLKAAKELGIKELPVILADEWTEEQKAQFLIKDNVNFGEWNHEELANEWDAIQLQEWGLDLPVNIDVETLDAEDDEYEMPNEIHTDIVVGDLFEIGEHRLLCGDSTDSDAVAKLMNGEKADVVFTDPPYDIEDNEYASNIFLFTENAHVFVMHDDRGIVDYLRKSQLEFKQFFVANFQFSSPRGNDPYLMHILISHEVNGNASKHQNLHDGMSSILKLEYRHRLKDERTEHKHQKPIEFIAKFLNHYSHEKSICLDLFFGSGSTMVASHQLNRKCYGMELDPKYCQVIIDRMMKLDSTLQIKRNGKPYKMAS
jgi:DNA modification methylase